MPSDRSAIEIQGPASGLLDDPLPLRARGGGAATELLWRARLRDDDGRVWRAAAQEPGALAAAWEPAKATSGPLPALQSLRPVRIDVHVEAPDGRTATRTLTRVLVGDGVRIRRWRDGELTATLCLPSGPPCATALLDASAGPQQAAVAALAAPLLASRGVLALALMPPRAGAPTEALLSAAVERLAAVPGAGSDVAVLAVLDPLSTAPVAPASAAIVLPPGVGLRGEARDAAATRAVAWDALLARLGARPRERS